MFSSPRDKKTVHHMCGAPRSTGRGLHLVTDFELVYADLTGKCAKWVGVRSSANCSNGPPFPFLCVVDCVSQNIKD